MSDSTPHSAPPPGTAGPRIGRYEILSRIAAGGMGEVFIARSVSLLSSKRVALKLLLPHLAQEQDFVQMFLDEARIASRMNHPNVIPIFDVGEADGRYFIAMQLVEGVSLARLLRVCRKEELFLPLPVVRLIARGLCDALQHAHTLTGPDGQPLGIVHRDVSPHNVLISKSGAVLLTDFGIAKAVDNLYRTRTGEVRGKYAYMAPEQMRAGAPVDARADVFAAAATLFETYSLVSPFARRTDPETIDAIRHEALPNLLALRPEVGARVTGALLRGMARDPARRFPSALALRDALLDGEVAELEDLGRWVRELCEDQLAVHQTSPTDGPQTRSLVARGKSMLGAGSGHRRRLAIAGGGLALLVALGTLGAWSLVPGSVSPPVASVAPEVAPSASPPPTEPSPGGATDPTKGGVDTTELEPAHLVSPNERVSAPATPPHAGTAPQEPAPAEKTAATAKRPARTQGPIRPGYLTADASPWAQLWIDGRQVDRTPISRYPLPPGKHQLRFRNPELGKEVRRTVHVKSGEVVRVRVELTP